jgi:hypothetical protein
MRERRLLTWLLGAALAAPWFACAQSASAPRGMPTGEAQRVFKLCDARAYAAMGMARTYLGNGRDKAPVREMVKDNTWGTQAAETLFRLADAGKLKHHAEFAADVLVQCAVVHSVPVGAPKSQVGVCLARTDVAYLLHADRKQGLVRQEAISRAAARLKPREVYPTALLNGVAEAIYVPKEPPDLRALSSRMLWTCIRARPQPSASAASG